MTLSDSPPDTAESVTWAVVEAVAEARGVDPTNLDLTLEEYLDTEALNRLVDHDRGSWTLSFELPGHTVTVTSEGLVLVDGRQEKILDPV